MRYVLVFLPARASFRIHAEGCSASTPNTNRHVFPDRFDSVKAASDFADKDERERTSDAEQRDVVKAYGLKVCACCKKRRG